MNRHQRRADAARGRAKPITSKLARCKATDLARAIVAAEQAGQPGVAALLREVAAGRIALFSVDSRNGVFDANQLNGCKLPVVAVVGDDDYRSTGPAGWKYAATIASWARCGVIHAAGATAGTYGEAIRGALVHGRAVLVETNSAHAADWAAMFIGKPALLILPRKGAHPIAPRREAIQ